VSGGNSPKRQRGVGKTAGRWRVKRCREQSRAMKVLEKNHASLPCLNDEEFAWRI
jgi:hypothetical protein